MFQLKGIPLRFAILFLAVSFMILLAPSIMQAQQTINVPGNYSTIQGAINAANNGDTVLVAPGTYVEKINFNSKAITVTSSGGPSVTIIDGGANGSVVTFSGGETLDTKLSGFTIRNGFYNGPGGGIYIFGASPSITGNIITGNHADYGVGIAVFDGSPLIRANTITANDQKGITASGGGGGGIVVYGDTSSPAAPQIIGNTIASNSVAIGGNGGGISVANYSSPLIQGNLIQGNMAYSGGGISLQSYSSLAVVQNVIVNNSSLQVGNGGGISITPGYSPQLILNNTISGNTAINGTSGVYVDDLFGNHTAVFTNNIIVAGTGQIAVNCYGPSQFFSSNDVFSNSGQAWIGGCDITSHPGNISVDPQFVNAGTDFHLKSGSPAVDAGDNSPSNLPQTDYDGNPRIWDGNNDCVNTIDLGAYELHTSGTAAATISPVSLNFSSQYVGTASSPQAATITSTGAACYPLVGVQLTGPFTDSSNCPSIGVPGGTSCVHNISFAPANVGTLVGNLTATSTTGEILSVSLLGTGILSPTTTTAVSSSNPSTFGQSVAFTATVQAASGATPTGTVTFMDGTAPLGTVNLSGHTVQFSTATLTLGSHTITASYSGDADSASSNSSPLAQIVNPVGPTGLVIDAQVYGDQSSAKSSVSTGTFSITLGNELLLAFVATDYTSGTNTTVTSVSGGGLTWVLVLRTNRQSGTSEIWRAFAPTILSNIKVTAALSRSVVSSITVVSFSGVDTSGTNGSGAIGATKSANSASGAPAATLITTRNNSWVFGVGNDFDRAIARTPGPSQVLVHQNLSSTGDTYWVQRQNAPTLLSGTSVTINDTAPASDRYNLAICEILPAP